MNIKNCLITIDEYLKTVKPFISNSLYNTLDERRDTYKVLSANLDLTFFEADIQHDECFTSTLLIPKGCIDTLQSVIDNGISGVSLDAVYADKWSSKPLYPFISISRADNKLYTYDNVRVTFYTELNGKYIKNVELVGINGKPFDFKGQKDITQPRDNHSIYSDFTNKRLGLSKLIPPKEDLLMLAQAPDETINKYIKLKTIQDFIDIVLSDIINRAFSDLIDDNSLIINDKSSLTYHYKGTDYTFNFKLCYDLTQNKLSLYNLDCYNTAPDNIKIAVEQKVLSLLDKINISEHKQLSFVINLINILNRYLNDEYASLMKECKLPLTVNRFILENLPVGYMYDVPLEEQISKILFEYHATDTLRKE